MATFLDLYEMRRSIAKKRQSSHTAQFTELHDLLVKLKRNEPYNLDFETKLKFEDLTFFINQPFGRKANVPGRDNFIYRICTIVDVVKGTSWRDDEGTDSGNWMQIYSKSRGGWSRLSDFANGTYKCRPRSFSWWTSYPLYEDIISGAHRVGMTNNWVAVQSVVLRCPIDYINKSRLAFVPTVIDAYMQLIFHPTKDEITPRYGITIDLSLYPVTLAPGIDEVVISELSVDPLEILPINADSMYRRGKNNVRSDSAQLSNLLGAYYGNL